MSFPTAAGLLSISNLRAIPPMEIGYGVPDWSGTAKDIVSAENPAVDIAWRIITPKIAKKAILNTTFYNGCTTIMKLAKRTNDASLIQSIASLIALKFINTKTH